MHLQDDTIIVYNHGKKYEFPKGMSKVIDELRTECGDDIELDIFEISDDILDFILTGKINKLSIDHIDIIFLINVYIAIDKLDCLDFFTYTLLDGNRHLYIYELFCYHAHEFYRITKSDYVIKIIKEKYCAYNSLHEFLISSISLNLNIKVYNNTLYMMISARLLLMFPSLTKFENLSNALYNKIVSLGTKDEIFEIICNYSMNCIQDVSDKNTQGNNRQLILHMMRFSNMSKLMLDVRSHKMFEYVFKYLLLHY